MSRFLSGNSSFLMAAILFLNSGCELFRGKPSVKVKASEIKEAATEVNFLNSLSTLSDYSRLQRDDLGLNFVKYSHFFLEPNDPIYFQNTSKYPFHLPFMSENIPTLKNLQSVEYESLLGLAAGTKTITAGAVYWAQDKAMPEFQNVPGTLGVALYFQGKLNLDEAERIVNKLKLSVPFAENRIVLLFDKITDFTSNKLPLLNQKKIVSNRLATFLNQGLTARTYNPAKSYGFLRIATPKDMEETNYTSKDILVLDEVPLDLSPVSGILTNVPQAPHSHVIFRSVNQKIPNAFIPGIIQKPEVIKNLGKLVEFEARENGEFSIKGADDLGGEAELNKLADAYFLERIPKLPPLRFDFSQKDLKSILDAGISKEDMKFFGAKATNFAMLDNAIRSDASVAQFRKPFDGGLMAPFSLYLAHIKQPLTDKICKKAAEKCVEEFPSGCDVGLSLCTSQASEKKSIQDLANAMFNSNNRLEIIKNGAKRKSDLAFVRQVIRRAPLPTAVEAQLKAALQKSFSPTTRVRFRSSTNAEDLAGLNGAGLYISKSACLADEGAATTAKSACMTPLEETRTKQNIEILKGKNDPELAIQIKNLEEKLTDKDELKDAVRSVYSSIWTEKAYLNRDFYGLNHNEVFMGNLIAPSFTDENANGVLVLTAKDDGNFVASFVAQRDDVSVTNPEIPGALPEEWFVESNADGVVTGAKTIRNSTFGAGPVLTEEQVKSLMKQLVLTQTRMLKEHGESAKRLDIEFIIDGNGIPLVKQARPL